jgi:hypothetical protein
MDSEEAAPLLATAAAEDIAHLYHLPPQWTAERANEPLQRLREAPDGCELPAAPIAGAQEHFIVQFIGPIKRSWLRQVTACGTRLRRPLHDFTYLVRCLSSTAIRLAQLKCVRWIGRWKAADAAVEISASATSLQATNAQTHQLPNTHIVEFFGPRELRDALPAVIQLGVDVTSAVPQASLAVVRLRDDLADPDRCMRQIGQLPGVASIRPRPVYRTWNDVAAQLLAAHHAGSSPAWILTGRGETIGICDTGLDTGNAEPLHPDFAGRVKQLLSYPLDPAFDPFVLNPRADDGPADVDSGHGTHVAGSAVGSGAASVQLAGAQPLIRGLAHEAELVFQAVEQECRWKDASDEAVYGRFTLGGLPEDLSRLLAQAYQLGTRIHSNSWGGGIPGDYDAYCRQLDHFVWQHPDFCMLVAAGNEGSDQDGDGQVNLGSISPPATAKNCIAVGASESVRPDFQSISYGQLQPDRFRHPQLADDAMADNGQQVALFSSRGPTRDGRLKPDLLAPGTFILSTRSQQLAAGEQGWGRYDKSSHYFFMGGTSMATPLVAGAAALVRQYLRERLAIAHPSAALVKAALIATARPLSHSDVRDEAAPSFSGDCHQGWGLVCLAPFLAPEVATAIAAVDRSKGLETGQLQEYRIDVQSADRRLRIALAYSDYPGERLVNNLNLIAVAPDGTLHRGNAGIAPRSGKPNPRSDSTNNVEVIELPHPRPGRWTVRILGANVPRGPQAFAWCACGPCGVWVEGAND